MQGHYIGGQWPIESSQGEKIVISEGKHRSNPARSKCQCTLSRGLSSGAYISRTPGWLASTPDQDA